MSKNYCSFPVASGAETQNFNRKSPHENKYHLHNIKITATIRLTGGREALLEVTDLIEISSMVQNYCQKAICSSRHPVVRTTNSYKFCKCLHHGKWRNLRIVERKLIWLLNKTSLNYISILFLTQSCVSLDSYKSSYQYNILISLLAFMEATKCKDLWR